MQEIDPTLRTYIETQIIPRYRSFDKAHRTDHVRTVIAQSLRLARHYPEADAGMVYVAAAYHDAGLAGGREHHHLLSGELVASDAALRRWFTPEQLDVIREAVEDHRASSQREPRSIYGRIVAEADRVIDPQTTLRRTVQYGLEQEPELDEAAQYARFRSHLLAKYGDGGYLKLWIPASPNAARLRTLRRLLADEPLLRVTFRKLYRQERKAAEEPPCMSHH